MRKSVQKQLHRMMLAIWISMIAIEFLALVIVHGGELEKGDYEILLITATCIGALMWHLGREIWEFLEQYEINKYRGKKGEPT